MRRKRSVSTEAVAQRGEERRALYLLLAHLYLREVDAAMLDSLRAGLGESLGLRSEFFEPPAGDLLDALRQDFTELFILGAPPYASVFLHHEALLNTDISRQVLEVYHSHGFEPNGAASLIAADHLGLELEFMAHLIEPSTAAPNGAHLPLQRQFLAEHLLTWAPLFTCAIEQAAATDLYRQLARCTAEFLLHDHEHLARG